MLDMGTEGLIIILTIVVFDVVLIVVCKRFKSLNRWFGKSSDFVEKKGEPREE